MDDLRPLTAEEAAACGRHPLPAGIPDALVNKAQLARALGVTEPTLTRWMADGLPVETGGTNGKPYEFRLSVAFAWRAEAQAAEGARRAAADDAVNQLAMHLSGGAVSMPDGLSINEQRQIVELTLQRDKAARDRGELLDRAQVVAEVETVFAMIRDGLDALPDRLGRELALDGGALERIERACDDVLTRAADKVERFLTDDDGASG